MLDPICLTGQYAYWTSSMHTGFLDFQYAYWTSKHVQYAYWKSKTPVCILDHRGFIDAPFSIWDA